MMLSIAGLGVPLKPLNEKYVSCECRDIDGVTYSLYTLSTNLNNVIVIIKSSNNILFDGQNHMVNGNSCSSSGINIISASNIVIGNITVKNFHAGIYIDYSGNIVVKYSSIELNQVGTSIGDSVGNTQVINNNIMDKYIGLHVNHSSITLCLNNFINNNNDVFIKTDYITAN